jgi:hypothetical protein
MPVLALLRRPMMPPMSTPKTMTMTIIAVDMVGLSSGQPVVPTSQKGFRAPALVALSISRAVRDNAAGLTLRAYDGSSTWISGCVRQLPRRAAGLRRNAGFPVGYATGRSS